MYLAIREIRFSKARYTLIATIMVLVACLVLFVTGLAQGLAYDNAASIKNMAATHFVLEQHAEHRLTRSQLDQNQFEEAGLIVGIENAEPLGVRVTTVSPSVDSSKIDVTLLAVNPQGWLAPAITEGSPLSDQLIGHVLVDDKLSDVGVKLGTILVDQASGIRWTVNGFVKNESFSHTPAVFLNQQDWLSLQVQTAAHEGNESADHPSYNAIAIKTANENVQKLQAALSHTEVIKKSEAVSAIPGYKEEQGSLMMMIVFLFVISAFVLAVFFYVITLQKTSQFGILKAMGARTAYLVRSVALQVLILSISSLVISVLLVQLFEIVLPSSLPFQLGFTTLAITCLSFVIMSLAGSLFSVWKVARIDALDAIGRTAA
ncbi:putative ABC transport system permease protein [Paenibacillus endophyticus]|uniref:Putative hemin transport system permease protein HrtB n=1 Tax=Paenibacillus endophyticus TaxID=1294268 RepID=A0A7W5GCC9_9BACL|nr:ABC transporter permease [Paenibacillus endophyticus]MBB3155244.1 putative ABC transport system permease protein [Paenibacillus endophyticus]